MGLAPGVKEELEKEERLLSIMLEGTLAAINKEKAAMSKEEARVYYLIYRDIFRHGPAVYQRGEDRAPSPTAYLLEAAAELSHMTLTTERRDFSSSQKAHSGPNRE